VTLNYGMARTLYERGQFGQAAKKLGRSSRRPEVPDAQALQGAIQLGMEREGKADAAQAAREAFQKPWNSTARADGAGRPRHFALADGDATKPWIGQEGGEYSETAGEKPAEVAPGCVRDARAGHRGRGGPKGKVEVKADVKLHETAADAKPEEKPARPRPQSRRPTRRQPWRPPRRRWPEAMRKRERGTGQGGAGAAGSLRGARMKKDGLIEKIQKQ